MKTVTALPVDFIGAARRHYNDARLLMEHGRRANAGQLFGLSMECGLKALLIACGVPADDDGAVRSDGKFYKHMPFISGRIDTFGQLIPDGLLAQTYLAKIPGRKQFRDWSVDHRYYRESAVPLTSLPAWELAAKEMNEMLDQAKADGVM